MKKIVAIDAHLEVHEQVIEIENIFKSTRTLGVHINPALTWNDHFQVMRKTLYVLITKLMNIDINTY